MITVSSEIQKIMQTTRPFVYSANVTFLSGSVLTLTEEELSATNCRISISSGGNSFPLGNALSRSLSISLFNIDGQFEDYDFFGAKIQVKASVDLEDGTEDIDLGTFTVTEPETYGSIIDVTAYDNFYKADVNFETSSEFPLTAQQLYIEVCNFCGLIPLTADFKNNDYSIKALPENKSCRQLLGLIAMLAGGNAVVDGNNCKIAAYDTQPSDYTDIDGGVFDKGTPYYTTGDSVDGGVFSPWEDGGEVTGGTFNDLKTLQVFSDVISQTISTDDVVITGVRIQSGEAVYNGNGSVEGYVLELSNELTNGNEQDAADRIAVELIGLKFRPFELSTMSYPLAEFGDFCYLVNGNNLYQSFITDIDFTFKGATSLKCSADSPVRNSSKQFTSQTSAYQKLRNLIKTETTQREAAEEELSNRLSQSSGLYSTIETTDSGNIYYLHDKREMANSTIVYKVTTDAIGVSTDGGETWNAGLTVDGVLIAQIMNTIGINFDWGTGGTLTLGGRLNGNGRLEVKNASGTTIGYIDNTGVHATHGSFSGTVSAANITGSEISGTTVASYTGNYDRGVYLSEGVLYFSDTRAESEFQSAGNIHTSIEDWYDTSGDVWVEHSVAALWLEAYRYLTLTAGGKVGLDLYPHGENSVQANMDRISADYVQSVSLRTTGTKNRMVKDTTFGDLLMYSYETASPYFGDIGTGALDENGVCYISIDSMLAETINDTSYCVFLQKEGAGDVWVETKEPTFFVVHGTPGTSFAWELKALQKGYETLRVEDSELQDLETPNTSDLEHDFKVSLSSDDLSEWLFSELEA